MEKGGRYMKNILFFILLGVSNILIEAKGRGGIRDGDGISLVPAPDEKVFNLENFDAVGDGETDDVEV